MATGTPVLNALNTRYIILDGEYPPLVNPGAFGPAWFVEEAVPAATPDEEIALVGKVDLRRQAVLREAPVALGAGSAEDAITLTSYAPNELHYSYSAAADRLAVFSEIGYPDGWHAAVDGTPVELLRADWTLRAALLPAGEHELTMTFLPESYRTGARVSACSSLLLLLLTLLSLILSALREPIENSKPLRISELA